MKPCIIPILFALFLSRAFDTALADTGTYEIAVYRVHLAPGEDGRVEIAYYQLWKVTSGHIPWITVGMANRDFRILEDRTRLNAGSIRGVNQGRWSGVHIDLDKDYQAGETFEVEFAVLQEGLFHQDAKGYRLHFIPGWYDRAKIGKLTVELEFFIDLEGISARPRPSSREDRKLVWESVGLKPGGTLDLSVVFPEALFPKEISLAPSTSSGGRRRSRSAGEWMPIAFLIGFIAFIVIFVVFIRAHKRGHLYGGGGRLGIGSRHYHGTGCVVSCACACVACACACACAGGGGAGCDRKLTHRCPLCAECRMEDCPLREV
jgi:hypothetical protein